MKDIIFGATKALMLASLFATGAVLTGCEEGPVEEAGEEVDNALDEAGDELE